MVHQARRLAFVVVFGFVLCIGCAPQEPQVAVTFEEWASEHAVSITDLDSDLTESELASFSGLVGEANYVGLGESRHDTREQVLMKGLLVRHLVEDLGFRALLFEESYPHALEIDRYVTSGDGDLGKIMNGLAGWMMWDSEEFASVIEWVRDFNKDRPENDMVRVFGIDVMAPALSVTHVLTALENADIASSVDAQSLGMELIEGDAWPVSWGRYSELSDERKQQLSDQFSELVELVKSNEDLLPPGTLRLAETAQFGNAMFSESDRAAGSAVRELGMADMTNWILENEVPDQKAIIWAHNVHVAKSAFTTTSSMPDEIVPMGALLSDKVNENYIAIGATFGSGFYSADYLPSDSTFETLEASTMDGACALVGHPFFLLDFRESVGTPEAESWLAEPHEWRSQSSEPTMTPATAFDAIYYIDKITRATPTRLALEKYNAMSGG